MEFEICMASLVALVERPLLPHNLRRHIDTAVDPYLANIKSDKETERLRIAALLGERALHVNIKHLEAVQNYLAVRKEF